MKVQRLVEVKVHKDWEQDEINFTVHFRDPLSEEAEQYLRRIIDGWALLGSCAAYPDPELSLERSDLLKFGSMRYYSGIKYTPGSVSAEWMIAPGGIGLLWYSVLLNCLEAFHVEIAPIAQVEIGLGA